MTITLAANSKDINVTGGTSGTPITWDDIVAADTSGGWGRITTLNANVPKQYLIATDTRIYIGNGGTTPTYVAIEKAWLTFANGYFRLNSGATAADAVLRIGRNINQFYAAQVTMTRLTTYADVQLAGSGTLEVYYSTIAYTESVILYGLVITGLYSAFLGANTPLYGGGIINLSYCSVSWWSDYTAPASGTSYSFVECLMGEVEKYNAGNVSLRDVTGRRLRTRDVSPGQQIYLYDCDFASYLHSDTGATNPAIYFYRTFGLTVQDAAGTRISGASVTIKNAAAATVYSGTTDGSGRIADQDILYKTSTADGGVFTDTNAGPHTVTITKAGYLDRVLILDMSSKHVDVEVLEPVPDWPGVGDVRDGVVYDAYTGTLELPAVGDVESGVGYGANGTELTGTLEIPVVDYPAVGDVRDGVDYDTGTLTGTLALPVAADVKIGVGYGAGGTELTGLLQQTLSVGEGIVAALVDDVIMAVIED